MCLPVELHPSSGDGQTDVGSAVPSCNSESGLHLPSALLPRLLLCPQVNLDFLNLHELALDPVTVSYFEHSGGVDPTSLDAPDTDDDCILDFLDDDKSVDSGGSSECSLPSDPLQLHHRLSTGLLSLGDPSFHAYGDEPDSPLSALYGVDRILHSLDVSHSAYYDRLHILEPALGPDAPVHAHMDGGSQATTCPHVDLLWHPCMYPASMHVPALHVADTHPHYLTGEGYLCVPDLQGGHMLIQCFYTPSLPATILSPDAAGHELGCQGWSCFSHFFGGSCFIRLHHCCHTSGDCVLPATPIHGLLYSEPLVPPLTPADCAHPHPHPKLHVQCLASSPSLACPCDGSREGSCSACSPLQVASCPHCSWIGSAVGSGEGSAVGSGEGSAVGSGEGSVLGSREGPDVGALC